MEKKICKIPNASSVVTLVARELKGKRQFCSVVCLNAEGKIVQKIKYDKKQVPNKLHVEDYILSDEKSGFVITSDVKTVVIASINSFCLSGNSQDKTRPCCLDLLSHWHKQHPDIRLLLVYKKLFEVDKRLLMGTTFKSFEKYLSHSFSRLFVNAELLKWNGDVASHV